MPYFVRRINRENWPEPEDDIDISNLDADALNDLKTQDNTLSVWYAEDEQDLEKAFIAYLASLDNWTKVEEVEFVALSPEDINEAGINWDDIPNFTYIEEYKKLHRDLTGLKYESIGKMAEIVIKAIKNEKDKILSRGDIEELFKDAIRDGKLKSDDIDKNKHGSLRKLLIKLEKELTEEERE